MPFIALKNLLKRILSIWSFLHEGTAFAVKNCMRRFITRMKTDILQKTLWILAVSLLSFSVVSHATLELPHELALPMSDDGFEGFSNFSDLIGEDVAGTIESGDQVYDEFLRESEAVGYLVPRQGENGEISYVVIGDFDIGESNAALGSWYGPGFQGRKTCNGELYNQNKLTLAAHKWLGKIVCVSGNGKQVTAKINDCGPYERRGKRWVPHSKRSYDLSRELMRRIKGEASGLVKITVRLGSC